MAPRENSPAPDRASTAPGRASITRGGSAERNLATTGRNAALLAAALAGVPPAALAFDSGSSGARGDLTPTVNTVVELPDDGILHYRSVTIPAGVTVRFKRNRANTPVVLLAQQNVVINGAIDVSGGGSSAAGGAGDGNVGDDALPGGGGPGGFDGGRGGPLRTAANERGSDGLGPGGGRAGLFITNVCHCGGSGGGHAAAGLTDYFSRIPGGVAYGSDALLPLIGGSGGGGGVGGTVYRGSGGGGGGGAILIAATGTINVTGAIYANGGTSGQVTGGSNGSSGGGGAGGAIRLVATTIAGAGTLSAAGGTRGDNFWEYYSSGGNGAAGRIRLEAENLTRTTTTTPAYTFAEPGPLVLSGPPRLRIVRVGDVDAPADPTGTADMLFPATLANPVTVQFEARNVPVGATTVKLTVTPYNAAPITMESAPLIGDATLATASVSVTLPPGPSVLIATTSFQVTLALGEALSRFANNERVQAVRLSADAGDADNATLITESGREYAVPAAALALASGGR